MNSINSLSICFIDCQSTGSNPSTAELLELAYDDHAYLLQTIAPLSKKIQSLTGITPQECLQAISPQELFARLSGYLTAKHPRWIIAHFARFEKTFLERLWQEHAGTPFPFEFLCTHKLAKLLHSDLPTFGLRAVASWYGDTLHEHKRAQDHVNSTRFIWQRMLAELEERGICDDVSLQKFMEEKPAKPTIRKTYLIERAKRLTLPDQPGVYRYVARSGRILYVGKATSLKHRVNSYFTGGLKRDHRKREMLAQAADVQVTVVASPLHAGLLEYQEIQKHQPPYNKMFLGNVVSLESELEILLKNPESLSEEDLLQASRHVFYGIDDLNILRDGLRQWRAGVRSHADDMWNYRRLVQLGLPLLKEWITIEKQKLIDAAKEQENDDADEIEIEEDDEEEIEFIWTPELIATAATAWTRRAARDYIRRRYLRRLRGAVISQLNSNEFLETSDDFDERQAKVLLHELRRAAAKGEPWQIVKPWPMQIPFWI